MTPPKRLGDVVSHGLCTGCGLCESIGGKRLPMALNHEGFLRPAVPPNLEPGIEAAVLKACPGLNQRGPAGWRADPLWGPHRGVYLGYARDEALRHAASSGGVATAAAAFLLARGAADAVLHVSADVSRPVRSRARISRTREELVEAVGARYGPAAPLQPLHELLGRGERIVVLGKPCDIAAVRNLAREDDRVDRFVVATITFLCAGLPSHEVSRNIIGKYALSEGDVRLLRYRGHGCPGPTRIETRDGRAFEQTYVETWSNELNQGIQFRCKICPDSTGEQADLVCSDAWDGAEGYPLGDGEGYNAIIARTAKGLELLRDMIGSGVVSAEPMPAERLMTMQPHHARRKSQILARLAGLMLAGQPVPSYRRLRLVRAALWGAGHALANIRGTIARVRRGNNREHVPHPAPPESAGRLVPEGRKA
ncbi:MAG TPA: Coenzyme F420 hydrogenase/dehydrogenase, beta subunit C-terminal domain [Mesorhizobium sp.]|nr:Coenzyme F420 hydrogenase/dehydrogenase, beta subunit C-terminal domain [Mesorhizobium sp.]